MSPLCSVLSAAGVAGGDSVVGGRSWCSAMLTFISEGRAEGGGAVDFAAA